MSDGVWAPILLSIRVAALATAVVVAAGLPLAMLLARRRFPGRAALGVLLTMPLVLPPTVLGYVLLLLLGRYGPGGRLLMSTMGVSVVFHWTGAVIASAVASFPLFIIPARSAFESVDRELEDVARLLGRSELSVFTSVTLPLAWRGLSAGAALSFARALGDFGATLMVAGDIPGRTRTASLAIYDATQTGQMGRAAVLSALVAAVSGAAVLVAQRTRTTAEIRP